MALKMAIALLVVVPLTGCATASEVGSSQPQPTISASTPCSQWLADSVRIREDFLRGYWTNLSEAHAKKVIELKDAFCRGAEGSGEPGREPTVGPFQPLVDEVISGTYG
jgi:hypothetical protein